MIRALRAELVAALDEGRDSPIRLGVESVELEVRVTVSRSTDQTRKVDFKVVQLGTGGKDLREDVHVVKLSLRPATTRGGPLEVHNRRDTLPER